MLQNKAQIPNNQYNYVMANRDFHTDFEITHVYHGKITFLLYYV